MNTDPETITNWPIKLECYITVGWKGKTNDKHSILLARFVSYGAFTLANFTRDFALSLHVLPNKNYLFSLLNVQLVRNRTRNCASVNAPFRRI